MSTKTSIQWTDASWNPIRGCSRVSAGCQNCYAEGIAARFSGPGLPYEGLARRRSNGEPQWTGEVHVVESHMFDPLSWREPRRVFVNSVSDLFHEDVSFDYIRLVFATMMLARRHTFQILTKRPARMRDFFAEMDARAEKIPHVYQLRIASQEFHSNGAVPREAINRIDRTPFYGADQAPWPLPNVWLGVSVENQATADERIPLLVQTPAAIRFLSCEPLLGPLDLNCIELEDEAYRLSPTMRGRISALSTDCDARYLQTPAAIDWVIVGGESGRNARPFDLAWARSIVAQCREADVACFVKQLGRRPLVRNDEYSEPWPGATVPFDETYQPAYQGEIAPLDLIDSHGGDMDEWPEDLRVREFPPTPSGSQR